MATPPAATSFPTNIAGFIVTPPGAVKIGLFMQGQTSGAGAIDLRMARPMITGATASQTEHPAFSPGPNSFDAATRNNVTYATTAPAAPADGDLWVDTSGTYAIFKLRSGGAWETGANALSAYNALSGTPVALADINTTESSKLAGIASGATRNRWYVATSDPGGADGDGWKDTSTTPPRFRLKAAGSWIDVSSLVTDTAQITDGAQLGLTALWTGVTGTAKPQDNADVTANSQLTLVCNPLFEFDADYTGAISTALPFDRRVKAMKGTTDVSTTTSFALTGGGGLALSINNTAGDANRGVLTVGATTTGSGTVTVVGTFAGGGIVNLPLTFTKTNGPAPAGGGSGATSASILSSGAIGGTSMAAFGSEVIVRSDGAGKIRVSIDAYASGGTVTNGDAVARRLCHQFWRVADRPVRRDRGELHQLCLLWPGRFRRSDRLAGADPVHAASGEHRLLFQGEGAQDQRGAAVDHQHDRAGAAVTGAGSDRPTHRHKATGDIVFAEGYRAGQIEALPAGYWDARLLDEARAAAVAEVKRIASDRILSLAPVWRQLNDARDPGEPGRAERIAQISAVRSWSNEVEAKVNAAANVEDIAALMVAVRP